MSLDRISFKKGRTPEPRLQHERQPDIRQFWTPEEEAILLRDYATKGPAACKAQLPHRSIGQIYQRAVVKFGLRAPKATDHQRLTISPEIDAAIREAWPRLTERGDLARFAEALAQRFPDAHFPRWAIGRRARDLGLANVLKAKEPNWTEAECRLLQSIQLHNLDHASRVFSENGFNRTPTSIALKAKRLGISRRYNKTLSATRVANILGVDIKWVTAACLDGTLVAEKRPTARLPQQGGDPWSIHREDLVRYIEDHLERVDIRKVDKFAFVDLLLNS